MAKAKIRAKKYDRFRGVDFSTDPSLVDDTRSPWAPNLVADMGGMPEKRPGWRTLVEIEGKVNGLFSAEFSGERHLLAHVGTKLYRWYLPSADEAPEDDDEEETPDEETPEDETPDETPEETPDEDPGDGDNEDEDSDEPEELATGLPDSRSMALYMKGKLWIFTGTKLLCYDGEECNAAEDVAYIPTTLISRDPAGGGTTYEAINLLTGGQKVGFLGDGSSKVYTLPYQNVDSIDKVEVDGEEVTTGFTTDTEAGTVTFETAPARPVVGAEDNVFITFTKTTEGYADRINKCTTAIVWGANGTSDRIFAAGNPDFPNQDFSCGYADGTYWPDTGYAVLGTEETQIVGYRRFGEFLAVIKEDSGQDSTVFMRSGYVKTDGSVEFSVKPCLAGAGGVSRFGFGNIGDEQLILTGRGIYALTTNSLTAERIAQNRSARVDPKLIKESLGESVSCSYDGCFLVFVGGRVYGLDGRQPRSYPTRNDTAFLYECFYWEDVPARCVMRTIDEGRETLYFGTEDGHICRFNTDDDSIRRFNDDGEPIVAIWATRSDDDGDPMVQKTMIKQGNAVTIKPYLRSGAKVLFRTDKDAIAWQAASGTMDIFSWEDIDFSRFTFNANDAPQEIPFGRKVKKYKRLQILIKNDALNEGFGVYCIVKHYVNGNFAKN